MDEKRLVDGATALAEKQSRVIKIEPAGRPQNMRLRVAAYTCSMVSQITRTAYSIGAVLRQSHIPKRRRRWVILWNNSLLTRTAPKC